MCTHLVRLLPLRYEICEFVEQATGFVVQARFFSTAGIAGKIPGYDMAVLKEGWAGGMGGNDRGSVAGGGGAGSGVGGGGVPGGGVGPGWGQVKSSGSRFNALFTGTVGEGQRASTTHTHLLLNRVQ